MTEFIQSNYYENQKPVGKPSVVSWNGVRLVANQSIQSVARELVNLSANQDLVSVVASGKQSAGKTQLLFTLAHLTHKFSKFSWKISYFGKKEILTLSETVKTLNPNINHILIFDDIAFLKANATSKQVDQIQETLSVVRHLEGGKDVRIILMKSVQYLKSISPFLRQHDMLFLASVDDNERKTYEEVLGKKYHKKINQLAYLRAQGSIGEEGKSNFVYEMGGGKRVVYGWKRPFLPFLYKTSLGCRLIMSPLRTWIDPVCNVCSPSNNDHQENTEDVKEIVDDFISKFKDGSGTGMNVVKTAVKIKLLQTSGILAWSPRVCQAVKFLDKLQENKLVSIESIASKLDLTPTRTSLLPNKQPEIQT